MSGYCWPVLGHVEGLSKSSSELPLSFSAEMEIGWIPFNGPLGSYSSLRNRECIENCRHDWQVKDGSARFVNEVAVRGELAESKVEERRDWERSSDCAARRISILECCIELDVFVRYLECYSIVDGGCCWRLAVLLKFADRHELS